ncbi:hypothetical protein MRX96_034320 [Rhipicephalus microplus]
MFFRSGVVEDKLVKMLFLCLFEGLCARLAPRLPSCLLSPFHAFFFFLAAAVLSQRPHQLLLLLTPRLQGDISFKAPESPGVHTTFHRFR